MDLDLPSIWAFMTHQIAGLHLKSNEVTHVRAKQGVQFIRNSLSHLGAQSAAPVQHQTKSRSKEDTGRIDGVCCVKLQIPIRDDSILSYKPFAHSRDQPVFATRPFGTAHTRPWDAHRDLSRPFPPVAFENPGIPKQQHHCGYCDCAD